MNSKLVIAVIAIVAVAGLFLPGVPKFFGAEGDTNYINLVLSGNASVAGTLAVTGNTSLTGTLSAGTTTLGNTVIGNGVLALSLTSATAATSITAAQFCGNGVITVTNDGSQTTSTLTFPVATSTYATCLTNLGGRKYIDVQNTSSTSYIVTIASSTGVTMLKPFNASSTFTLIGGGAARIEYRQITTSTVLMYVERMQ